MPTRPPTTSVDTAHSGDEDLPDWLRNLSETSEESLETEEDPIASYREEPEEESETSGGYPDWLSGLLDENEDFGATDEPLYETQEELSIDAEALPDWLSATADTSAAPTAEQETSETPDWLLGTADEQAGESDPEASSAGTLDAPSSRHETVADAQQEPKESDQTDIPFDAETLIFSESELPDWLTEAQSLTTEVDTPLSAKTPIETAIPQSPMELEAAADLPSWLPRVDNSEDSGDIELPDWLQAMSQEDLQGDFQAQSEAPTLGSSFHTPSEIPVVADADTTDAPEISAVSPTSPEPADLPDWLSRLEPGAAEIGGAAIFSSDDQKIEEQKTQPQESPSWLDDIEQATEAVDYEPSTPAFFQGDAGHEVEERTFSEDEPIEIPDWLRGLDFSTSQQPQAQSAPFEGDMPARAELPSWLQELMPPSAATAGGLTSGIDTSSELIDADIPDWLVALRPEPSETGEPRPRRIALPTPAEPEGPLEGLPGILQSFALVDAPADAITSSEIAIPEGVVAQAQLWQRLLEQPRSEERTVSHTKPQGDTTLKLIRWLVVAILLLGVLGTFRLLPEKSRMATASPEQMAPGAPALIERFNALQPGDDVVVAVEYGTAYAEEMSQIAIPLLKQLSAQQVNITFVSTLPEGAALSLALAAEAEITTVVEEQADSAQLDSGYLAGRASGISAFLSQPNAQTVRHILILTSQPERLRWWIEQVQLAYDTTPLAVSLSAGVSASAGPVIAPYLQTLQIQGWLVGLPDILAYRELRGAEDTTSAARTLDVLMLAHWATGGLLVIGLLVSLVAGKKGTR